MRYLSAVVVASILAGCTPVPKTVSSSDVRIDPDETYALVSLASSSVRTGQYAMCQVDSGEYRLSIGAGILTCGDFAKAVLFDERGVGLAPTGQDFRLSDGSFVRLMAMRETGLISVQDVSAVGTYVLAGRRRGTSAAVLNGPRPSYRVMPGKVHYIGHAGPGGNVQWRDPSKLAAEMEALFPGVSSRLVLDAPQVRVVQCPDGGRRSSTTCRVL